MRTLLPLLLFACSAPKNKANARDSADSGDPILVTPDTTDAPIPNLPPDLQDRFEAGQAAFKATQSESMGLGPTYVRAACGGCHARDGRGAGLVKRMVRMLGDQPHPDQSTLPYGSLERLLFAGGATQGVLAPNDDQHRVTVRQPTPLWGRGYMEAIPEQALRDEQARQAEEGRVSGKLQQVCWEYPLPSDRLANAQPGVCGIPGRFGLKAKAASVDAFTAEAFRADMSITSEFIPYELPNPDGLTDDLRPGVDLPAGQLSLIADYVRLIDLPAREAPSPEGIALFEQVGCDTCHKPSWDTDPDWELEPLSGRSVEIYSDLLLHDMGASFDDGIVESIAQPSEWRTAPLIGLAILPSYMHDSRAASLEEAILAHGDPTSEALFATQSFQGLTLDEQRVLLDFLETL